MVLLLFGTLCGDYALLADCGRRALEGLFAGAAPAWAVAGDGRVPMVALGLLIVFPLSCMRRIRSVGGGHLLWLVAVPLRRPWLPAGGCCALGTYCGRVSPSGSLSHLLWGCSRQAALRCAALRSVLPALHSPCPPRCPKQLEYAAMAGVGLVFVLAGVIIYSAASAGFPAVRSGELPLTRLELTADLPEAVAVLGFA